MGPGQLRGEGGEEIVQRPGDDDVVEEAHVQRDEDDREAHAWGENTAAVSRAPLPASSNRRRRLAVPELHPLPKPGDEKGEGRYQTLGWDLRQGFLLQNHLCPSTSTQRLRVPLRDTQELKGYPGPLKSIQDNSGIPGNMQGHPGTCRGI